MSAPPSLPTLPAKPPAPLHDTAKGHEDAGSTAPEDEVRGQQPNESPETTIDDKDGEEGEISDSEQPPLPDELPPPLPNEEPPVKADDDGWEPVWDENAQAFYFYNRFTNATQWENPRVPQLTGQSGPRLEDTGPPGAAPALSKKPAAGGYDPAIHGDYDPDADYAKVYEPQAEHSSNGQSGVDPAAAYAATATFNRFTGKWQGADINPEKFSDENKSKRQMNAFFDVDAAANAHDGKSLKAERSNKKLSRTELKAFREKRREKKEEKRRAWLRD
ncbi:hypothetical protein H2198_001934 [Neophaeococcomyces mojaviensis]|uniref:Uncharacterized protein n=1 Tax=Neophaeococcomyces mojaviensis TaxID=3383035 RepID=A0ACC3AFQ1_9EURO|nr:hypothetical protein H2198_001934 [Knufia sp. JES_112]